MADKHPAVSAKEEELTSVDPGALDSWRDEATIAEEPATDVKNGPSIVVNRNALGSESETVDEQTHQGDSSARAMPKASIVVRTGPHEGESYPIAKPSVTIGRALNNDIVLADRSISRHHAIIEFDGDKFYLRDLGSGNGIIVNGRDEDERYRLRSRDAIEFGRSIITFESKAMAVPAPDLAPPTARKPDGKPARRGAGPAARPTLSMRGVKDSQHAPVEEVDDEASTIAGQRGVPDALSVKPRAMPLAGKDPKALVNPRERGVGPPRRTVASPAVPIPRAVDPRPATSRPTLARSSAPPIIRPVSVEDEEEPTVAHHRPPARSSSLPPPEQSSQQIPNRPAARKTVRASVPPPMRSSTSAPPPRAVPRPSHTSSPPPRAAHTSSPPPHTPPRPGHSSGGVVYPTAPQKFNRSGAAMALSPRSPQAGMLSAHERPASRKWIPVMALFAIATIIGVTVAAISGSDKKAATTPAAQPSVDSGPQVVRMAVDAGAANDVKPTGDDKIGDANKNDTTGSTDSKPPVVVTLEDAMLGTSETMLVSTSGERVGSDSTLKPDKTDDTPDKTDETPDKTDKTPDKTDKTPDKTDEADSNAAKLKKLKSRAADAYRDRNFARAATLTKSAAAVAKKREARKLRKRASNLSKLGAAWSKAKSSSGISAYSSYRTAARLDGGLGRKHISLINAELLGVAPDAARTYMARGDYTKAATAVTVARKLGDRARTASILSSLERKAKPKIKAAKAAQADGDTAKAKAELSAAKKMLPQQSPLFSEASDLLADL